LSDEDKDSKTEEPSQYRLDQSREKGEVASSKELTTVILLTVSITTLVLSSFYMYEVFSKYIEWLFKLDPNKVYEAKMLTHVLEETGIVMLKMVGPLFLASLVAGILAQLFQIGFIFAPDQISFKPEKLNPLNGLKRIFSMKSVVEALKGMLKFIIVISITYLVLRNQMNFFIGFLHSELTQILSIGQLFLVKLIAFIILGLSVLAILDFAYEKYSYHKKMMMTKKEMKDELKEKDGNPEIKQKIKNIQREMSRKRMMKDLPKADVIITNPTHLSVAIRYNPQTMIAPVVIGKGADLVALKIREIAKFHNIPIVENIPLARALYANVKIGEAVPRDLYKMVAQVLAYVFKLKKKQKALGVNI
jgi:flagellar biosynthetic protein FlhB